MKTSNNQFNLTIPVVMVCARSLRSAQTTPSPSGRNCRLTECYSAKQPPSQAVEGKKRMIEKEELVRIKVWGEE